MKTVLFYSGFFILGWLAMFFCMLAMLIALNGIVYFITGGDATAIDSYLVARSVGNVGLITQVGGYTLFFIFKDRLKKPLIILALWIITVALTLAILEFIPLTVGVLILIFLCFLMFFYVSLIVPTRLIRRKKDAQRLAEESAVFD